MHSNRYRPKTLPPPRARRAGWRPGRPAASGLRRGPSAPPPRGFVPGVAFSARLLGALLLLLPVAPGQEGGRLVIVGGGLSSTNAAPHRALLEGQSEAARIAVLATASGVPERSGPAARERLASRAGDAAEVRVLPVPHTATEAGDAAEVVAEIERSRVLWFTGGDQSRITRVFRPEGRDTRALQAMRLLLEQGGAIGGSSAGAAIMSDPMITGGRGASALRHGRRKEGEREGVGLGPGLGFFPHAIVDQHFFRRARFGRLVAALEIADRPFGLGVAENRALHVDLAKDEVRALGEHAALLIDAREARRSGLRREGLRLSLLGDGDRLRFGRDDEGAPSVTFLAAAAHREAQLPFAARPPREWPEGPIDPLGRHGLSRLLHALAAGDASRIAAEGEGFRVILQRDERTRLLRPADGGLVCIDVLCTIEPLATPR